MGLNSSVELAGANLRARRQVGALDAPVVEEGAVGRVQVDEQVAPLGVLHLEVVAAGGAVFGQHQVVGRVGAAANALFVADDLFALIRPGGDRQPALAHLEGGAVLDDERVRRRDVSFFERVEVGRFPGARENLVLDRFLRWRRHRQARQLTRFTAYRIRACTRMSR